MTKVATATEVQTHKCDCKHEFQDRLYGTGQRVMHPCKAGKNAGQIGSGRRCTVCAKVHTNVK